MPVTLIGLLNFYFFGPQICYSLRRFCVVMYSTSNSLSADKVCRWLWQIWASFRSSCELASQHFPSIHPPLVAFLILLHKGRRASNSPSPSVCTSDQLLALYYSHQFSIPELSICLSFVHWINALSADPHQNRIEIIYVECW